MDFTISAWCTDSMLAETGVQIFRSRHGEHILTVFSQQIGKIAVSVRSDNSAICAVETRSAIEFTSNRPFMLSITFNSSSREILVYLNGVNQETVELINFDAPEAPVKFTTTDCRWLFLGVLEDLRERIERGDQYNLVKASELLRQLLFDSSGDLIEMVSNKVGFTEEIQFTFCELSSSNPFPHNPTALFLGDSTYPERRISGGPQTLVSSDKKAFLNSTAALLQSEAISTQQLIEFVLYHLGGTHATQPNENDGRHLKRNAFILQQYQDNVVSGQSLIIRTIDSIAQVALIAVQQLEDEVRASLA